jgi:hypothetical protein
LVARGHGQLLARDHSQVLAGDHSQVLVGRRRSWDGGEGPGTEEELGLTGSWDVRGAGTEEELEQR